MKLVMKKLPEITIKIKFWQLAILLVALLAILTKPVSLSQIKSIFDRQGSGVVRTVSAAEIYPEFTCPCCGQPLNKEEPCCNLMIGMIDFIDQKISAGLNEEEVILATVKEFGLDRLTKDETREQIKQILSDQSPEDSPKITTPEDIKDLGEVSQASGEVQVDFELRNEGGSDLTINKLDTSCGCTSAVIIYQNQEGPHFTMEGHSQENSTDWKVAIAPNNSAILRVFYDPNMHGELRGPVTRTVTVFSNDPVEFTKKVEITLTQIP